MAKQHRSSRKPAKQEDDDGAPIAAQVTLALGRVKGSYVFEQVAVSTDDPENLCITFANPDGKSIKVVLPRAELRKHLSWRMFINL